MTRTIGRHLGTAPLLLALLVGDPGGCQDASTTGALPSSDAPAETRFSTPAGASVDYQIAWDWSGTSRDEQGRRSWTTALGYQLTMEQAYIATTSMELIPCATLARRPSPLGLLSPREARADHDYNHDASLVTLARVEDARDEPLPFGQGTTSEQTYCQLHILSSPVAAEAPDGFRLQGWSAYFRGTFRREGSDPQAFEAFIGLGQGALLPLSLPAAIPGGSAVRVTLTRTPVKAFDEIDFVSMEDPDIAFEALGRLGTTAAVEVRGL